MLIWCLKQLKDFILQFSISGSFFSQKAILNQYTVIIDSFPSGGCVEVVGNGTIYYGSKDDVNFVKYHTLAAIHFINHEGLCQITITIFNIYICLMNTQEIKKVVSHLEHSFYKQMCLFQFLVDYHWIIFKYGMSIYLFFFPYSWYASNHFLQFLNG